jgi:hypothetical protein
MATTAITIPVEDEPEESSPLPFDASVGFVIVLVLPSKLALELMRSELALELEALPLVYLDRSEFLGAVLEGGAVVTTSHTPHITGQILRTSLGSATSQSVAGIDAPHSLASTQLGARGVDTDRVPESASGSFAGTEADGAIGSSLGLV